MKMQYDYYTQTEGFPDVQISFSDAIKIVNRFIDAPSVAIGQALKDGVIIRCSNKVAVWAEEAMIYNRHRV